MGVQKGLRYGRADLRYSPAIRPERATIRPTRAQGRATARALSARLVRESRYKNCIVARGSFCVTIWLRYRLRYGAQCPTTRCRSVATQTAAHATWRAVGPVLRYKYCIVTGRGPAICTACAGDTATIRPVHACDTSMTLPGTGATRPRGEPRHDAQRAQPESGCAPGAPNPVLTQCTLFSHSLVSKLR